MTEKKYVIYRMDVKRHNGNVLPKKPRTLVRGCELLPGMHRNAVPLKCGCRNVENHRHIHRRGATELFRNPVRGAKRMRAGGSPLLVAGRLPTDGYDAADSTFLAKIFSVIYTTALRR